MTGWARYLVSTIVLLLVTAPVAAQQLEPIEDATVSGENCSFRSDPAEFLTRQLRARREVFERTGQFGFKPGQPRTAAGSLTVSANELPRHSFIDVEIFDRLAADNIPAARLSTDEEFFRRIHLDLIGRIPSAEAVRAFVADGAPDKRSRLIDTLVYSPAFVEKWTMWMGDLLQSAMTVGSTNRQVTARNAYHDWIRYSMIDGKSLKTMAYETVAASGNNYYVENGAANFSLNGRAVMGPAQDTYDWMLYQATSKFLGVSHYDCLMCHDGRRHLDDLSLWGRNSTRLDAQRMAAFFSRTRLTTNNNRDDPNYLSWTISDVTTGNYGLNTNFGNRPNRVRVGALTALDPEYRDGTTPRSPNWRAEFAGKMIEDPLLAVNFANRIWKQMFNYGLVEPVDTLDPARLDPANPPPAPWTLQASHPKLLNLLASALVERDYNLREFVRLITESAAYQLSSRYDGEWNLSMVPLFARHYPRRLEGEEVHDAIVTATGVAQEYTVAGWVEPVKWAVMLPEPIEPRTNGASANFMNTFLRGNRNTQFRSQSGSIVQQLFLMNDAFVTNRAKVGASAFLRSMAQSRDNEAVAGEMFLAFLNRQPTEVERGHAVNHLARAATAAQRNAAVEDLAWALINKAEFIFSY